MPRGRVAAPPTEEPELFDGTPPGELAPEIEDYILENASDFTDESISFLPPKSLHSKLAEIYEAVSVLEKTGTAPASMGGFSFVEASVVAGVIRKELAKRHITMMPTTVELISENERSTRSNQTMVIQTYRVVWTFTDGDSGETAQVVSLGSGADTTDKAAPKAQTNAMKYAMLMAFLIPTSDDPERFDVVNDGGGQIIINASDVGKVKPGGRQAEITSAQFDAIRKRASDLMLDPLAMKQVVEHALKEDGHDFAIPSWPAAGNIDEQRSAILGFIRKCSFEQAATILSALHAGEET